MSETKTVLELAKELSHEHKASFLIKVKVESEVINTITFNKICKNDLDNLSKYLDNEEFKETPNNDRPHIQFKNSNIIDKIVGIPCLLEFDCGRLVYGVVPTIQEVTQYFGHFIQDANYVNEEIDWDYPCSICGNPTSMHIITEYGDLVCGTNYFIATDNNLISFRDEQINVLRGEIYV